MTSQKNNEFGFLCTYHIDYFMNIACLDLWLSNIMNEKLKGMMLVNIDELLAKIGEIFYENTEWDVYRAYEELCGCNQEYE